MAELGFELSLTAKPVLQSSLIFHKMLISAHSCITIFVYGLPKRSISWPSLFHNGKICVGCECMSGLLAVLLVLLRECFSLSLFISRVYLLKLDSVLRSELCLLLVPFKPGDMWSFKGYAIQKLLLDLFRKG